MKPIILFVHGALSTPRSFSFIKRELCIDRSMAKDFRYDIRKERGNDMVSRLSDQLTTYGDKPVTLICHSFGGILGISAASLALLNKPQRHINIVTMGTPMGGSSAASWLRILKPGSTFFKNIGSYDHFMRDFMSYPLPCRVRALITTEGSADWINEPNDGVVPLSSQMRFAGDPNFHPLEIKLNHFEVLMSDQVVGHIRKELPPGIYAPSLHNAPGGV
jgi:pimeloyl-ACP methyl ester carboxylesterase